MNSEYQTPPPPSRPSYINSHSYTIIFCLFWCFTFGSTIFQSCWHNTCLPGLHQYQGANKVFCSRTQCSDSAGRGGKSLWDVLSGVTKNGMGCFVPWYFVRLPAGGVSLELATLLSLVLLYRANKNMYYIDMNKKITSTLLRHLAKY